MPNELKKLPFDEQNEQDFEELTKRISDALVTIERRRAIPATQEKLAELAECSRKTLHNRKWPIVKLKEIKENRRVSTNSKPKIIKAEYRLSTERHIERERLLIKRVRNLQEQNGKLFEQVQSLEEQASSLIDTNRVLEDEIVVLKDEKVKLAEELRQYKQPGILTSNISRIPAIRRTRSSDTRGK